MAFFASAHDFFVLNSQSKTFELIQKSYVSESFISHAKAPPAKRSKKDYGSENALTNP